MTYPVVSNYRITVKNVGEWEWDVEYQSEHGGWNSYRSGKAWTLKRALKKARNHIPVTVIQSQ
jgi:hypothetical protein